jgi:hypothetical protein
MKIIDIINYISCLLGNHKIALKIVRGTNGKSYHKKECVICGKKF